jgi:hypothetical protein
MAPRLAEKGWNMGRSLRLLVGISPVALMALGGHAALAQVSSPAPAATSLRGPDTAARSDVSLTVNARYDDNVPRLNDLQPNTRNLARSDVRISPALQLNVARNLGRHQIGLAANLGYDFYARNTLLNREHIDVAPSAYLNLPVCDLALNALASRRLSELGEIAIIGIDPTLGTDNTETRKQFGASLICGDSYGLKPTFEYQRSVGDNSNPQRIIADYRTTRIQPGVGYSSPALGDISIYAFRVDTDLPNQILPTGQRSGYRQTGYGLSYARAIGTRLRFNASVSHVDVTPYTGGGRSGLNGSLSMTLLASDRLQITAFANRAFTSTLTGNSTYELSEGYGASANYAVNDRLRLHASASVAPRGFFYVITPTQAFIDKQTQYDISAGASYQLNPRLRLNFDTGAQRRDANPDYFDYRSFYAAIGIALSL